MPRSVLMCPPKYFEVTYSINTWMDPKDPPDQQLAIDQWENLVSTYRRLGLNVELMEPTEGLPDQVFTANGGLVIGSKVMLPKFKYPQRQAETEIFANWFESHGYTTQSTSSEFEGEGDCLSLNGTLLAGHGFRSSIESHAKLAKFFNRPVLSLKLIDPRFYHLDTALAPICADTVMYYPGAFDAASRTALANLVPNLITASEQDALHFGLNAVVVNQTVIMNEGAKSLEQSLQHLGYSTHPVNISEFQKSGGGVKCLTLELRN